MSVCVCARARTCSRADGTEAGRKRERERGREKQTEGEGGREGGRHVHSHTYMCAQMHAHKRYAKAFHLPSLTNKDLIDFDLELSMSSHGTNQLKDLPLAYGSCQQLGLDAIWLNRHEGTSLQKHSCARAGTSAARVWVVQVTF